MILEVFAMILWSFDSAFSMVQFNGWVGLNGGQKDNAFSISALGITLPLLLSVLIQFALESAEQLCWRSRSSGNMQVRREGASIWLAAAVWLSRVTELLVWTPAWPCKVPVLCLYRSKTIKLLRNNMDYKGEYKASTVRGVKAAKFLGKIK